MALLPVTKSRPSCAQKSEYCQYYAGYPFKQIFDVVKDKNIDPKLFSSDELPDKTSDRWFGDDDHLCDVVEQYIYPSMAKSVDERWKHIINLNQGGFTQGVKIKYCGGG